MLDRLRGRHTDIASPPHSPPAVSIAGDVQVQVAGESFHLAQIHEALWTKRVDRVADGPTAVLRPEPDNPYDRHAVAVDLEGRQVGYLARGLGLQVQHAVTAFVTRHGRLPSCPATVTLHDVGPQVVLHLDPAALGLSVDVFDTPPELARVLFGLLKRLDGPTPAASRPGTFALQRLSDAEAEARNVDEDWDRGPRAWPRVEKMFAGVLAEFAHDGGRFTARAWFGLAHARRYQRGRRDDALAAYVEALHFDPCNTDAWLELIEFTASAPHVPILLDLLARAPFSCRAPLIRSLTSISHQADRLGNMTPSEGARLRAAILALVEEQGDDASIGSLYGADGLRAEKRGDMETAVTSWRRAIRAGCADATVADRFSIWLTRNGEYAEARRVLEQALAAPPADAPVHERMRRRLARCVAASPESSSDSVLYGQ